MKPYLPNNPSYAPGAIRIMHTLRPEKRKWGPEEAASEVEEMEALHLLLERELGISLSRNDVLRIAVHRELVRRREGMSTNRVD